MNRVSAGVAAMLCLLLAIIPAGRLTPSHAKSLPAPPGGVQSQTSAFSLDGVSLELTTSFLTDATFAAPDPDSTIQVATAVQDEPRPRQLSITAVPFGVSPATESLPVAGGGQAEAYRAALRAYRGRQLGNPQEGPEMRLFGETVIGSTSVLDLPVRGEQVPVSITEWVVEAGERLWIVRASQVLERSAISRRSVTAPTSSLAGSVLTSHDLASPSTSLAPAQRSGPPVGVPPSTTSAASDLPFPPWWDGDCDVFKFLAWTGVPSFPLGAEYRGLKACGPRPSMDPARQAVVDFGVGYSQIEWQCPELSKRFLYLAYGIPPYPADGNEMVWNYDGDLLEKVWNGTVGRAPQPDDVLSYGAYSTYGHTSVVVASDVDATGNGTVHVIEQNSSADGYDTLEVSDWRVGSYPDVIGWLHHPGWSVAYYGDESLDEPCARASRGAPYLFESWSYDAPDPACPADNFSARFSRSLECPGGDYTFALGYDEGARLKIDGETVVDGWGAADQHYQTACLDPGRHQVTVEYYDRLGDAALTAFWWGPGFELARDERLTSSNWYAEYWGNPHLWWDPVVKINGDDGPLNHLWFGGTPADGVPADRFSSRFRRSVVLEAGRWRFDVAADDGVRFWIDDQLIVDEWQPQVAVFTPTVSVSAAAHALRVDHFENVGHAGVGLDWERISDSAEPAGWVTSPLTGTLVETCPITIEAEVDSVIDTVDRVEFHAFYDGAWHHLGDDDAQPYRYVWNCLPVADQPVRLMVHVWDEGGNEFVDLGTDVAFELDLPGRLHLPLLLGSDPNGF